MAYKPNPRVTIDGTDFTGHAIDRVTVNKGRRTVYERPNAGFASVRLIDIDGIPTFRVGQTVVIGIDLDLHVWEGMEDTWATVGNTWENCVEVTFESEPIFTGTLSDFTTAIAPAADKPVITHSLQAVGPLATINRRQIYVDGRTSENDGSRILNILETALGAGLVDSTLVDPGVFTLADIEAEPSGHNALRLAQDAGFSGEGLLFETSDGFIGYTDADRRRENEIAGALNIPFGFLDVDGVRLLQQLADITNEVSVEFDGGAVLDEDAQSIAEFGRFATDLRTNLVSEQNAQVRAVQFLERHSTPRSSLDELNFNLLGVEGELRSKLLLIQFSDAILLDGVPARLGFLQFRGFVEGFELSADRFSADLKLVISNRRLSIGAQRWQQVVDTIAWQDVDAALTWDDASEVTV